MAPQLPPMDLASLAAQGQAETATRQAGAQGLQSAAHAQALSEQLGQLAASSEAARRNYSFQGEQSALDRQLQLGLAQAQAARSGGGGGGGGSSQAFQMAMQQMENDEWYRRQQFLAELDGKKNQPVGNKPRDFGKSSTSGTRGQALTSAYDTRKDDPKAYVMGGNAGSGSAAVNLFRSTRGSEHQNRIREIVEKNAANPQAVVQQAEAYFRDLAKKKKIRDPQQDWADEYASVALWNLGYTPEAQA